MKACRAAFLLAGALLATSPQTQAEPVPRTLGAAAHAAAATLEQRFYQAPGRWKMCLPDHCGTAVRDWGADSLTFALFLRWKVSRDGRAPAIMKELIESAPVYDTCPRQTCTMWSDVPMWDAIAAARAYEVTRNPAALVHARRAFDFVDRSDSFARGACPAIDFQQPGGGTNALKTLETDSNYIKAALLLHHWTGDPVYLTKARTKYAAVRRYFLDPAVPLYSVYVFDDGVACKQLPRRFFGSVNGNMIYNGLTLAARTGDPAYLRDALATASAVTKYLGDPSGVYASLQADNDIAEPLVEAMYDLAAERHESFARDWITGAAAVARPGPSGAYGRFFDGPASTGVISAWSANGGIALAIAAGALEPDRPFAAADAWANARFIADPIAAAPASITFTGRAIALIGTIGDACCEAGHARAFIDGDETFDNTGIWQNKSPSAHALPGSVLLSWRWPQPGPHTIRIEPGLPNAKEGGSYIHLSGYELIP